jgi:hypothetical protein
MYRKVVHVNDIDCRSCDLRYGMTSSQISGSREAGCWKVDVVYGLRGLSEEAFDGEAASVSDIIALWCRSRLLRYGEKQPQVVKEDESIALEPGSTRLGVNEL